MLAFATIIGKLACTMPSHVYVILSIVHSEILGFALTSKLHFRSKFVWEQVCLGG